MKKNITLIVAILTILLSSLAFADLNVENDDLVINVNYEALDGSEKVSEITHQITVTNNGNVTENLTVSLENLDNGYDLDVSPKTLQLNSGDDAVVTISGKIPVDEDQGTHQFGDLKVKGGSKGDKTYSLKTDVQPMLEIKKIYVYADDYKVKTVNEDDDEVKNLKPGDEIELKFFLKNLFDDNYKYGDLSGTINILLDDNGFGGDIDEEEDFNLDAGTDSDEIILKFVVPEDADEDTFDLEIVIEAKDENKVEYILEWILTLEIERDANDLRINKLLLSPTELVCSGNSQLSVEIKNFGGDRQKYTVLKLFNSDLKIDKTYNFDLKQGNEESAQLSIDIKEGFSAGTYPLMATVYYDYNTLGDEKTVDLVVKKCPLSVLEKTETEDKTIVEKANDKAAEQVTGNNVKEISSSDIVKSVEDSYSTEDYLVGALFVAIVVILALTGLLVVAFFKK
ncbi:MAG: hypothetical protein KKA62_05335 [Nanoarchaeota archaeon]|nr:hypothetical protein [Nanoarchaeota archaeon]MBU1644325.1 hypothetical protein [Nanoarchaeota archaeon]MBU1977345.1 hypothetical protein [Nanoarchaeota archaeon]